MRVQRKEPEVVAATHYVLKVCEVYGQAIRQEMVILGDEGLDHFGSLQWVLVPPI